MALRASYGDEPAPHHDGRGRRLRGVPDDLK